MHKQIYQTQDGKQFEHQPEAMLHEREQALTVLFQKLMQTVNTKAIICSVEDIAKSVNANLREVINGLIVIEMDAAENVAVGSDHGDAGITGQEYRTSQEHLVLMEGAARAVNVTPEEAMVQNAVPVSAEPPETQQDNNPPDGNSPPHGLAIHWQEHLSGQLLQMSADWLEDYGRKLVPPFEVDRRWTNDRIVEAMIDHMERHSVAVGASEQVPG